MVIQARRFLTNIGLASVAGVLTGSAINSLKGKPERRGLLFKRTLIVSGIGLSTGLTLGFVLQKVKRLPTLFVLSTTATGTLCGAVTGGVYFSVREILAQEKFNNVFPTRPKSREYFLSAFSGGATGTVITLFTKSGIIPACSVGAFGVVIGAVFHVGYATLMKWRYEFLIRERFPEYAEEIIKEKLSHENADEETGDSGYLLEQFRFFSKIWDDIYDRMTGKTGRTAVGKLVTERRVQLQLLEEQENALRSKLDATQPEI